MLGAVLLHGQHPLEGQRVQRDLHRCKLRGSACPSRVLTDAKINITPPPPGLRIKKRLMLGYLETELAQSRVLVHGESRIEEDVGGVEGLGLGGGEGGSCLAKAGA